VLRCLATLTQLHLADVTQFKNGTGTEIGEPLSTPKAWLGGDKRKGATRGGDVGDAEPVESRGQRGDVVHQSHPLQEVARVRQAPRMTTLIAPALRAASRSEAMSVTLQALPAALPVRRDLT